MVNELEEAPTTVILDEEVTKPLMVPTTDSIEYLFDQGFSGYDGEDHHVDLTNEGQLPATLASTPFVPIQIEAGPFEKRKIQQVMVEVPTNINLLKRPD